MASDPPVEPAESTPHPPKLPAPKDRKCPYCHQAFTSSSLGRHLDLYIRPKNPKPPDGIHNVEEIRRIRGNITRRQARTSSLKRERDAAPGRELHAQATSSAQGSGSSTATAPRENTPQNATVKQILERSDTNRMTKSPTVLESLLDHHRIAVNKPNNWLATGVINDLPPRRESVESTRKTNGSTGSYYSQAMVEQRQAMAEELDAGKAANLALREVLSSVWEASSRSSSGAIFGFDPLTLDFPGLCLRMLPTPTTLFTPAPWPSYESWSINPPDKRQFDALQRAIEDRVSDFKKQRQIGNQHPQARSSFGPQDQPSSEPDRDRVLSHVADAYTHWRTLSEEQRRETWQLEILRAFARAEEAKRDAENTLETLRKQVDYLTNELRKHSSWSGQTILSPPAGPFSINSYGAFSPLRLASDTLKQLNKQGLDIRNWDYDTLLDKWKNVVKEERHNFARANGFVSSPKQRSLEPEQRSVASRTPLQVSLAGVGINGGATSPNPSRSVSASSFSAQNQRARHTSMNDSPQNADGEHEGEDEDADADMDIDDATTITHPAPNTNANGNLEGQRNPLQLQQPPPRRRQPSNQFKWPPDGISEEVRNSVRQQMNETERMDGIEGPHIWRKEFASAGAGHEAAASGART